MTIRKVNFFPKITRFCKTLSTLYQRAEWVVKFLNKEKLDILIWNLANRSENESRIYAY